MSELTIKDKVETILDTCIFTALDAEMHGTATSVATEQIMQLIDSAITEARLEAATMGAKFGNAAFRQQSIAEPGKPINLDVVLNSGIQQAQDWAKRTP